MIKFPGSLSETKKNAHCLLKFIQQQLGVCKIFNEKQNESCENARMA